MFGSDPYALSMILFSKLVYEHIYIYIYIYLNINININVFIYNDGNEKPQRRGGARA